MNTLVSSKINQRALELAREFKPNLEHFDNGVSFTELYEGSKTFCQVYYYDRTGNSYSGVNMDFNMDLDKKEEFLNAMELYHKKIEESQNKALDEFNISNYDFDNYFYFNRVKSDLGFCHVRVHERSKIQERKEREEMEQYYREEDEPKCSSCGDGGCVHCEPHRFI